MKYPKYLALVIVAITMSACSNTSGPFGANRNGTASGELGQYGSPSDPTSPAHFQEILGDRIFFLVDDATLTLAAQNTLNRQAEWLNNNLDYRAVIEGHADERGTREYNLALGARRANATLEYLLARGVPESRLQTISYGKERPIEICSDESCYSVNRRAVTLLETGLSG
ncbi:MAG: peptidoglycan-associated lipoprotein Pal [Aestuariivita sp.]|nr:peptidoglycan-associated lipoprotein Pal [Aestuariivita sp.]MCY4203495.1 peptidoglycan-associated lipoprotein Pal [Aestuariivita sp.]